MLNYQTIEKYVITGGPGVGKTTLLNHLQVTNPNYSFLNETAREIILEESQKNQNPILPWTEYEQFQYLVFNRQLRKESTISTPAIFDRSIVDGIAYAKYANLTLPILESAARSKKNSYNLIFILDPLPDYICDQERRENKTIAKELQRIIHATYIDFGYLPCSIPASSISERAELIMNTIREYQKERKIQNNLGSEQHYG